MSLAMILAIPAKPAILIVNPVCQGISYTTHSATKLVLIHTTEINLVNSANLAINTVSLVLALHLSSALPVTNLPTC